MKISSTKKFIVLLGTILYIQPENNNESAIKNLDEAIYDGCRSYAEVFRLAKDKHYKVSDIEQCIIKSLDTFLNCIDPHSNLLDPKTYKNMMDATSGEFFGIGVVIDNTRNSKDKQLIIIDTIPGGPADKAGVKPFDKIIEIAGKILEGMSTDEATAMLKGERNTKVHIKVLRENQTEILSFDITRDVVKEQNSLCFYLENQNIYYLALSIFSESSARQLEQLLTQAHKKEYKGLILDLRNNSGGLLTSAVDIAGLFLEKGSLVVTTKDKYGKVTQEYRTTRNPISTSIPIFILINNFTASAAEILAGALKIHANSNPARILRQAQDEREPSKEQPLVVSSSNHSSISKNKKNHNAMVFLVGTKTFGKGSVQEVIPISNNCAVKITTHLYFLPDDSSVQAQGIIPDFEIERSMPPSDQQQWLAKFYGREQALTNHIRLTEQKNETDSKKQEDTKDKLKNWTDRARQTLLNDNQFKETISLINLLWVGKNQCSLDLSNRQNGIGFINSVFATSKHLNLVEVKIEKNEK